MAGRVGLMQNASAVMMLVFRDLRSLADLHSVMSVEREVWRMADEELVPAALLLVSVKCGDMGTGCHDGPTGAGGFRAAPR